MATTAAFFEQPVLNSPYEYPSRHWELDASGQPTNKILEQLAPAGVQQAHKEDRIAFAAVTPWPGEYICAEGRYREGDGDSGPKKRAGIDADAWESLHSDISRPFDGPESGRIAVKVINHLGDEVMKVFPGVNGRR